MKSKPAMGLTNWFDNYFYPQSEANWDDKLLREEIFKYLDERSFCLDFGAGRGNVELMNFRGTCSQVAGVDVSDAVLENPFLDRAEIIDSTGHIPFPDETFDVVFSDNVLEHLDDPAATFKEIARVTKVNGLFIAKTPNKRHYMPLIASATPTWFHQTYNRWRGRDSVDTFPTRYKANTERDVEALAKSSGFSVQEISFIEGRPEYLRINPALYMFGIAYEKTVNGFGWGRRFRCVLLATLRKSA